VIDRLAKLNRSSRNGLCAAFVVVAAVAMYQWILAPFNTQLFAAQRQRAVVERFVNKSQNLEDLIEAKQEKSEQLGEKFDNLRRLLFAPEDVSPFFGRLQSLVEQTGCAAPSLNLDVDRQTQRQNKKKDSCGIVPKRVQFSVVGGYGSITKLLKLIGDYEPKIWIDSVRMEIRRADPSTLKCDIAFTIYIFSDKEASSDG